MNKTFDIKLSTIFSNICDKCLRPTTQINCLCLGPKEFICGDDHVYLWCPLHQKQIELPYQGYSHKLKWWTFKDAYRGECLCRPIGITLASQGIPALPPLIQNINTRFQYNKEEWEGWQRRDSLKRN